MEIENETEKNKTQNKNKNKKRNLDIDSDNESQQSTINVSHFPKFLIIEAKDVNQPISTLSPFIVQKAIQGIAGTPDNITKLRSGQFLVEVSRKSHSDNLLQTTNFVNIPVLVTPHRTMNTKTGVVRSRELAE